MQKELVKYSTNRNSDVIALAEAWLRNDVPNELKHFPTVMKIRELSRKLEEHVSLSNGLDHSSLRWAYRSIGTVYTNRYGEYVVDIAQLGVAILAKESCVTLNGGESIGCNVIVVPTKKGGKISIATMIHKI